MMIQANKVSSIPSMGENFSQGLTSKPVEGILYERRDYFAVSLRISLVIVSCVSLMFLSGATGREVGFLLSR